MQPRYSGIPSYRSLPSSGSTPDVLSEHESPATSAAVGGGRSFTMESSTAIPSHVVRRDTTGLEKLLRDAQSQVRELLPHREENVRLSTELTIQKNLLSDKEEEVKKLQRLVVEERSQRQQFARKAADDQTTATQRAEARARAAEDKLHELERTLHEGQAELERKGRSIRHLEEELVQIRNSKQDDRSKMSQKDTLLNTTEAERNRAVSQLEDATRANHKLEQNKKDLETQVSSMRQENDRLRVEIENLKREKADIQGVALQSTSKAESLQRRVESLQEEQSHLHQLRANLVQMEPLKEELALLRRSMETTEQATNSERMSRKNLEAERDQLLLRVRGLEMDIRRLESDCHRAQVDASERVPLRRENEDLRRALDEANAHVSSIQSDLTEERGQRTRMQSKAERTFTAVSRSVQSLRCALETRTAPASACGASRVDSSSAIPAASPIAAGTFIASNLSGVGTARDDALNESTDKLPGPFVERDDAADQRLVAVLDPLRIGITTLLEDLQKEQARRQLLATQLQDEQIRNSKLENAASVQEKNVTQAHLELAAASERETQSIRHIRALEDELQRSRITSKDRSAQFYRALAMAPSDGELDTTTTDEGMFHYVVEAARLTSSQRDRERRQRIELEAELKRSHAHAEAANRSQQELLKEVELKCQKEIRDMQELSNRQMDETSKIHADLRAAIQLSVERYEGILQDLQELQAKHHDALTQLAEREAALQDARHEADLLKREASLAATMLQKEKIALQEATAAHAHAQDELSLIQRKLRDSEHHRSEAGITASSLQQSTILLGRVVMGQRTAMETLTLERYWAMQYSKSLEQSLKTLLCACPEDGAIAAVPLHSSRRDPTCPRLLRFSSFRPVVVAVIAALRLQRMYFLLKSPGVQSQRVHSSIVFGAPPMRIAKSRGRTILLPQIGELSMRALSTALQSLSPPHHNGDTDAMPTSPSRLREAIRAHPWDVDAAVQSILDVLQASASPTPGVCWKRSFSFMWDMAAGLTRRNSLMVGTAGQAKLASAAVKQFLRTTHDSMVLVERSLDSAKRENRSLVEMVQVKEQRIQSLCEEITSVQEEKRNMVSRRELDAAEVALRETKNALCEEQIHNHTASERIASLKNSEAQLLLRQSELQNESRALAIELTRKSTILPSTAAAQRTPSYSHQDHESSSRSERTRVEHSPSPVLRSGESDVRRVADPHRTFSSAITGSAHRDVTLRQVTTHKTSRSDTDIMMLIRGIDEKLSTALHR